MNRITYLLRRWWLRKELSINAGIESTLRAEIHDVQLANRQLQERLLELETAERQRQIGTMIRSAL